MNLLILSYIYFFSKRLISVVQLDAGKRINRGWNPRRNTTAPCHPTPLPCLSTDSTFRDAAQWNHSKCEPVH